VEHLKIKFKKKRLLHYLIFGTFSILLGLSFFAFNIEPALLGYLHLTSGLFFTFQYTYDKKHHYLRIGNGVIHKHRLFGNKTVIKLDEITKIEGTDAYYLIKSPTKNLKVDPKLIDKDSLLELILFLKSLDLPSNRNLFLESKPIIETHKLKHII